MPANAIAETFPDEGVPHTHRDASQASTASDDAACPTRLTLTPGALIKQPTSPALTAWPHCPSYGRHSVQPFTCTIAPTKSASKTQLRLGEKIRQGGTPAVSRTTIQISCVSTGIRLHSALYQWQGTKTNLPKEDAWQLAGLMQSQQARWDAPYRLLRHGLVASTTNGTKTSRA